MNPAERRQHIDEALKIYRDRLNQTNTIPVVCLGAPCSDDPAATISILADGNLPAGILAAVLQRALNHVRAAMADVPLDPPATSPVPAPATAPRARFPN